MILIILCLHFILVMLNGFQGYPINLLGDTIARFVRQIFVLMEMNDAVERRMGCEAAVRAMVARLSREACRGTTIIITN